MKQLLLTIITLFAVSTSVFAGSYTVKEIPNVQIADASKYTSNPDNILSEAAVSAINLACDSLHTAGKAQIAVVVVEDIDSGDVFSFAHTLFSEWGVGGKKADNGLGILLVTAQREIRFVTGYGLEGILPDALCKRIQQQFMVEHLARGDYDTGMVEGIKAIAQIISTNGEATLEEELTTEDLILFCIAFSLFAVAIILLAYFGVWMSRKCPNCGEHTLQRTHSDKIASNRQYDTMEHHYRCSKCGFLRTTTEKVYKPSGGIYVGGGGYRGGGFGGGSFGGGFGGGSFGGGGAGSRF